MREARHHHLAPPGYTLLLLARWVGEGWGHGWVMLARLELDWMLANWWWLAGRGPLWLAVRGVLGQNNQLGKEGRRRQLHIDAASPLRTCVLPSSLVGGWVVGGVARFFRLYSVLARMEPSTATALLLLPDCYCIARYCSGLLLSFGSLRSQPLPVDGTLGPTDPKPVETPRTQSSLNP